MDKLSAGSARVCAALLAAAVTGVVCSHAQGQITLAPHNMPKVGEVDRRFVSYNVEAVEITGGRFWKPYAANEESAAGKQNQNQPTGSESSLYQYRAPIDLSNPRLRKLASALSPAYVRVSGTWRNSTYFQ